MLQRRNAPILLASLMSTATDKKISKASRSLVYLVLR